MKVVRLKNSVVAEIIPKYALPVEKWYGEKFAADCVKAPDDVRCGMVYENGVFSEPKEIVPEPTQIDRIEAQVTYTAMMTDTLLGV